MNIKSKICIATMLAAFGASSAFAAMSDNVYLKAQTGVAMFDKTKLIDVNDDDRTILKFKRDKVSYPFVIGVGADLMENVRGEAVFEHFVNVKHKSNITEETIIGKDTLKNILKSKVQNLAFNVFYDFYKDDSKSFYIGAGVGASRVSSKIHVALYQDNVLVSGSSLKLKAKTNVSFAGYVGGAYKLADKIFLDTSYSYKVLGKAKKYHSKESKVSASFKPLKAHTITTGIRFVF